jgi:hypothetical protein
VHHLDSWIKIDQLGVTCFIISLFNAQHVSNVSTSILRSLRLICWVISWVVLLWFDACWCYGVVWLGWSGIRMQASACLHLLSVCLRLPFRSFRNVRIFYGLNCWSIAVYPLENVAEVKCVGTTLTNHNSVNGGTWCTLNSGNASYHSVQNLSLSPFAFQKY